MKKPPACVCRSGLNQIIRHDVRRAVLVYQTADGNYKHTVWPLISIRPQSYCYKMEFPNYFATFRLFVMILFGRLRKIYSVVCEVFVRLFVILNTTRNAKFVKSHMILPNNVYFCNPIIIVRNNKYRR